MHKLGKKKSRPRPDRREHLSPPARLVPIRQTATDSLSQRVYQALKHDIITGVHLSGEALGEKELARQYSSSRTPVREAALRLQQDHLLKIIPNRGYFVTKISVQDLTDLYDYRIAVECACAELAAKKGMNPALLERLEELANTEYRISDRKSYENFIWKDTEFHLNIARLARNHLLFQAVEAARCQMERIMYAAIDIGYYGELPGHEHRGILDAINKRDSRTARQLMYQHIFGSQDKVLQLASGHPR